MGCTNSIEARRDMRWVEAATMAGPRASRSFSLPSVDRQRLRTKAASVLGNLGLAPSRRSGATSWKYATLTVEEIMMKIESDRAAGAGDVVVLGPVKDKLMMVPPGRQTVVRVSTPTRTPPNEPEVINAWELMAGLDDDDGPTPRAAHHKPPAPTPPPWMQADADVPMAFEFDPEILSGFREALAQDSSPSQPITASSPTDKEEPASRPDASACTPVSPATKVMPELSGIVRARINAFQEKIIERRASNGSRDAKVAAAALGPPGGKRKVVVYFTSLRGVRKTFVDCCSVRSILRSYGVRVDERDVSLHAAFKAELAQLLIGPPGAALPRVFIDGRYLGGAEDVQALHEAGELARALEGCDAAPVRKLGCMEACAACGDVRFVPCETCYGSCKIFVEDEEDDDGGEFRRCPDCNENGLIGCPVCSC